MGKIFKIGDIVQINSVIKEGIYSYNYNITKDMEAWAGKTGTIINNYPSKRHYELDFCRGYWWRESLLTLIGRKGKSSIIPSTVSGKPRQLTKKYNIIATDPAAGNPPVRKVKSMKYKVGDTVRIRKDLDDSQRYESHHVNRDMLIFREESYKIQKIIRNCSVNGKGYCYILDISPTENHWHWTDEMFDEPIKTKKKSAKNYDVEETEKLRQWCKEQEEKLRLSEDGDYQNL
jgi:hypothetical protein